MAVETRIDSGAGIITMTDSVGGNRLNPQLIGALGDALDFLLGSEAVRFILLRSNGPVFSLGMDLEAFLGVGGGSEGSGGGRLGGDGAADLGAGRLGGDGAADLGAGRLSGAGAASEGGRLGEAGTGFRGGVEAYAGLLEAVHGAPKTVVGLVEGPVKAGGVGLAAACDIVIAAESADFELSELYLGLIPANVMPYILCTRMPMKRAAYLVQSAACIDAKTAAVWGLADEVHPQETMEKALRSLGRRLMRISPEAAARQKAFARVLRGLPAEQMGPAAVEALVDTAADPRILEAVRAFSEGELPEWFERFRPEGPLSGLA